MRMTNRTAAMALMVAVAGIVAVVGCRAGAERADGSVRAGWDLLGEKTVNFAVDHDVVPVTVLRGTYRQIQLYVENNDVHFRDLKVHFANGDVSDVSVRTLIPAGGRTRVIDLPGASRIINRISLWYDTAGRPRDGRAVVKVYGKH